MDSETRLAPNDPSRPKPAAKRSKTCASILKKRANALRIENSRLKYEKQVMCEEGEMMSHRKQLRDYTKLMDRERRVLHGEFVALKDESVGIFVRGHGDVEIAGRAAAHLQRVLDFFNGRLSQINSLDPSGWSQVQKTLLLEHLKKSLEENASRMDEWIKLVIDAK